MPVRLIIILTCILFVLTSICVLFSKQIFAENEPSLIASRNIDGTVTFTVKTATYNGGYAPRNAGVIWITNSQNQFVKTIKVWAQPYRYTLVRWIANSGSNTTAAITGASLNTHQLHTVTWNAKDYQGNTVPDGAYTFNVEFTEHNATSGNMGKYKTLSFTKNSTPASNTYPDETYFRNLSLNWQPIVVDGTISGFIKNSSNLPIQGATLIAGSNTATSSVTGSYNIQIAPGTYSVFCSAPDYQEQTQTGVAVLSNQTTNLNFTMIPLAIVDGTISGIVKNSSNLPIQGATITAGSHSTTSSATGSYNIQIAPGTYDVSCSGAGYHPQTQSGTAVLSNQTTNLDFIMDTVSNDDPQQAPVAYVLDTNVPNPFKTNTAISYALTKNSRVSLRIYNLKGQLIRELVNANQTSGRHNLYWDGKLANGSKATSGKYIYTLSVNGFETSKTLTLVK